MGMHDTYFEYCDTYKKKYGTKCIVLIECGSFFEIYAVDNDTDKQGPDDIYRVCDLCNLQLSRKNKAILENSRSNPLMAGFPSYALYRHAQTLLTNQYTLVIVRQVTAPPNPKREVTEIMSPSINMSPQGVDGNYLMVIHCTTYETGMKQRHLAFGLAGIDVSTGHTWVYEVASNYKDPNLAVDELVRCFSLYQPQEVVLFGELTTGEQRLVCDTLGVDNDRGRVFHIMFESTKELAIYENLAYQSAVLAKAFDSCKDTMLSPLEHLGIERFDSGRLAFCYMIQFAFEHNEAVVKHLMHPEVIVTADKCIIEYNSAYQLQLIGDEKPLMSILNRCGTAFGGRYFKEQLMQPLYDVQQINQRLDDIDTMITSNRFMSVHGHLKKVLDLERMGRKMTLGTFQPCDWQTFHSSLEAIAAACVAAGDSYINTLGTVATIQQGYETVLDIDECSKYILSEVKGNIFKRDNFVATKLQALRASLEQVATAIHTEGCRVEYNERDNFILTVTKKRWDAVKSGLSMFELQDGTKLDLTKLTAKPVSSTSPMVKIVSPWIESTSDELIKLQAQLNNIMIAEYKQFLQRFADEYIEDISSVISEVCYLDFVATNAKNAVDFKYSRPRIVAAEAAWLKAKSVRHPILERIRQDIDYIPNDVTLTGNGLLLFGVNASGKSSLMKAIGLNVIMAQSGMYVPASDMELSPYRHIFTRISGNDNIFRGWSTFMVEMMELRNILQRSDNRSLVLGDELCSGTESTSALAIVAAGIDALDKKNTAFVFATHLHDLSKLELPERVHIAHMHVEVSPDGYLVFDRTLRDGTGSSVYGLEVCHGLGMPSEFLRKAHEIRCVIEGRAPELVDPTKSRYNAQVFKDTCTQCGEPATEVHHVSEQHTADADGFIGAQHKNRASNLMPLCEKCHLAQHHSDSKLIYIHTTKGRKVKKTSCRF